MARCLNIMIVPDDGGYQRRMRFSIFWFRVIVGVLIITLLMIIAGAIAYTGLVRRSLDYSRLEAENARLESENHRIVLVAREVDQSRRVLARIFRSLGGQLELGKSVESDTELSAEPSYLGGQISQGAQSLLNNDAQRFEQVFAYQMPTLMPVDGFISQLFFKDFLFPERSHRGIDIAAKTAVPIKAAASGRVVFSDWTSIFGNFLIIAHPNGYITCYGHNMVNLKKVDQNVRRGEPIALLGNSGRSSAPHLHFEIWKDGIPVDPHEFVHRQDED
ncbi:MAG: M23 family metallopeptidase [Candidatus Electryoneaceae bacterium]|nr:M23 family metallopeptidase [Candidatus Electryoneaceae bacterium]